MTHNYLVKRASIWAKNTLRCTVVMTELSTRNTETPDVLGFRSDGSSVLIECKASRADFRADAKKIFRAIPESGMGDARYYFTAPGLLAIEEIPNGWGLIECHEHQCRVVRQSMDRMKSDKQREVTMLVSAIRRLEISTAVFVRQEDRMLDGREHNDMPWRVS